MAKNVLIIGKSGSGKSASVRSLNNALIINVLDKPMPFKNDKNNNSVIFTPRKKDLLDIEGYIAKATKDGYKSIVIDDAGYLLTDKFMAGHRTMKGNAMFDLYNDIGDFMYGLIKFTNTQISDDVVVYFIMHETVDDFGNVKPKTIGKLLDDKICVEGMFSICLRALKKDNQYVFATNSDGCDCTKSPMGMFENEYIENSLGAIDEIIRNYYKE